MASLIQNTRNVLIEIYKPRYILFNLIAAVVYYYLYTSLIKFQSGGVNLSFVPQYLIFLLIATSSMLLTIAVYSIVGTRRNKAYMSASSTGALTTLGGGIIAGCGCTAPILFSLTALGISTSNVIVVIDFISNYQVLLFITMILINTSVIMYYLNRLADKKCKIKKKDDI